MQKLLSFVASGLLVSLAGLTAAAQDPAAASPYALLQSMIGGVWSTTVPAAAKGGAPQHFEMRYTEAENKQAVLFRSWLVEGDKRTPYQNGIYAWNAAKGKMEFFCTDARAGLTEGSYTSEGNLLKGDFTIYNKDGSTDPVHTEVTKVGADLITERIFLPKDDGWAKASDLRIERHRPVGR